jgi:hypothetical protein
MNKERESASNRIDYYERKRERLKERTHAHIHRHESMGRISNYVTNKSEMVVKEGSTRKLLD